MDYTTITQLIGGLGFPIAACCAMAWYINNTVKELSTALANNTLVMEKILVKLDSLDEKEKE